jgi:aryl-phospho-beta-D-glucosidase BglC (GH1 family)
VNESAKNSGRLSFYKRKKLLVFIAIFFLFSFSAVFAAYDYVAHQITQLSVNGNRLVNPLGTAITLVGVNTPGMEWTDNPASGKGIDGISGPFGSPTKQTLSIIANQWGANLIRLPLHMRLNPEFLQNSSALPARYEQCGQKEAWNPESKIFLQYLDEVDRVVKDANSLNMYVLLDLHRACARDPQPNFITDYDPKDYDHAIEFWQILAEKYKGNPGVLFDLYNEPVGNSPSEQFIKDWFSKASAAVHTIDADRIVGVGGFDYAYDLRSIIPLKDTTGSKNIIYLTHPYGPGIKGDRWGPKAWDDRFGYASDSYVIMATEWGGSDNDQELKYGTALLQYLDQKQIGFTAWGWHTANSFPPLIADWNGTPTKFGKLVMCAIKGDTSASCPTTIKPEPTTSVKAPEPTAVSSSNQQPQPVAQSTQVCSVLDNKNLSKIPNFLDPAKVPQLAPFSNAQALSLGAGSPPSAIFNLKAQGGKIVNGNNEPVNLQGVALHGMAGQEMVPLGLWKTLPAPDGPFSWRQQVALLAKIPEINVIRWPISAELALGVSVDNAQITTKKLFINTEDDKVKIGAKDIVDNACPKDSTRCDPRAFLAEAIQQMCNAGKFTILDMHVINQSQEAGVGSQKIAIDANKTTPDEQVLTDAWIEIAKHTKNLKNQQGQQCVIGAELYNEPQSQTWLEYRGAFSRIAKKLLATVPNWLMFIQGVGGGDDTGCNSPDSPCVYDQIVKDYSMHQKKTYLAIVQTRFQKNLSRGLRKKPAKI